MLCYQIKSRTAEEITGELQSKKQGKKKNSIDIKQHHSFYFLFIFLVEDTCALLAKNAGAKSKCERTSLLYFIKMFGYVQPNTQEN